MIRLTDSIPSVSEPRAEWVRLYSVFACYPEDALFWVQDEGRAYICCLDGDMTVYNISADIEELKEFIAVISPNSIFSDAKTLSCLELDGIKAVNVMARRAQNGNAIQGDAVNSRRVYDIFRKAGLAVPEYEYFAVDFCRRLNRGQAVCFLKEDECAAYAVIAGEYALIQGIASLKKGSGSVALNAVMQKNHGRTVLACCEDDVMEFYKKKEFKRLYSAAYWVRLK